MKGLFSGLFSAFASKEPEQPSITGMVVTQDGIGIPFVAVTIKDKPTCISNADGSIDIALTDGRFVIEKIEKAGYVLVSPKLPFTSERGNTKLQIVMKKEPEKDGGGQDADIIRAWYEKGEQLHNRGDYQAAQIEYNRAIEKAKEVYGDNNRFLAICSELYGDNYFAWKVWGDASALNYADAKTYYNLSLRCWIPLSGENSHDASRLHNKIGACWFNLENDVEATKKYEQALAALQNSGEENPVLLALIYDNMGKVAFDRSDWDNALKYYNLEYDELYTKHRDTGGLDNKKIANCLVSIGETKAKLKMSPVTDFTEAFKFYKAAGPLCYEVSLVCLELVKYYYSIRDYEKTMESLKKLLLVNERLYGKDSDNYQGVLDLMGKLEKEMNAMKNGQ